MKAFETQETYTIGERYRTATGDIIEAVSDEDKEVCTICCLVDTIDCPMEKCVNSDCFFIKVGEV